MVFSGSQALIPTRIDCPYANAAEQKARSTYEYLIDLTDDPDVLAPLRFLREREIVHFQRFGETLRHVQDQLSSKNFYAFNPAFDKPAGVGNTPGQNCMDCN